MRRPAPLPAALRAGPFTAAQARAVGVGPDRLRRTDVVRIGRGVYRWAGAPGPDAAVAGHPMPVSALTPDEEERLAGLLARDPALVLTHLTAARAQGLWLPDRLRGDRTLHLARPPGAVLLRAPGTAVHRRALVRGDAVLLRGLRVEASGPGVARGAVVGRVWATTPARTWRDLAGTLTATERVVLGDWLVRSSGPDRRSGLCRVEDLGALADAPGARHARAARAAASAVRDGAHSPPETELRLALVASGLPEPELQIEEWDPEFSPWHPATADLGWRRRRVVLQYEGARHDDPVQVERDTVRDAVFLRRDYAVFRASRADRRTGFVAVVALVRAELLCRGWRPGDPE